MGQIYVCDECGTRVTEYDIYMFIPDLTIYSATGDDVGYEKVLLCSKECSVKFIEKLWNADE